MPPLEGAVASEQFGNNQVEGTGPEALADYAGRLFDHHQDAKLPRLLFWEGLERGDYVVNRPDRAANCSNKVDGVIQAMRALRGKTRRI